MPCITGVRLVSKETTAGALGRAESFRLKSSVSSVFLQLQSNTRLMFAVRLIRCKLVNQPTFHISVYITSGSCLVRVGYAQANRYTNTCSCASRISWLVAAAHAHCRQKFRGRTTIGDDRGPPPTAEPLLTFPFGQRQAHLVANVQRKLKPCLCSGLWGSAVCTTTMQLPISRA